MVTPSNAADFMTPAAIVAKYGKDVVSLSMLYARCTDGSIPHYRLAARKGCRGKYLIKEGDFLAWLESNRHEGAGDPPPPTTPQKFEHLKL